MSILGPCFSNNMSRVLEGRMMRLEALGFELLQRAQPFLFYTKLRKTKPCLPTITGLLLRNLNSVTIMGVYSNSHGFPSLLIQLKFLNSNPDEFQEEPHLSPPCFACLTLQGHGGCPQTSRSVRYGRTPVGCGGTRIRIQHEA